MSKRIFISLFLFLSPVTCHLSPALAGAEEAHAVPALRVGVVNLTRVFEQYEKTKVSDTELDQISKEKQTERERFVSEIRSLREELVLLNEENRLKQQKAIEEKLRGLGTFDHQAKEGLRKSRDEAMKEILDEIELVVNQFAKEKGFTLILNEQVVLYGVPAYDVTDEVIRLLNERFSKKR